MNMKQSVGIQYVDRLIIPIMKTLVRLFVLPLAADVSIPLLGLHLMTSEEKGHGVDIRSQIRLNFLEG